MADLHSMMARRLQSLFLLLLVGIGQVAWAQEQCFVYRVTVNGQTLDGPTANTACASGASLYQTSGTSGSITYTWSYSLTGVTGTTSGYCNYERTQTACNTSNQCSTSTTAVNATWARIQVECPPECPPAGTVVAPTGMWVIEGGAAEGGTNMCLDQCEVRGAMGAAKDGDWWIWGPLSSTGQNCTAGTGGSGTGGQPQEVTPPNKPGDCTGTINGTVVPFPCSNSESTPSTGTQEETKTNPDGSTTTTSTSTTKKTECIGNTCTTTTTTNTTVTNSTGGGGGTTTKTETNTTSKPEFCAANPGDPQCGVDGGLGGDGEGDEDPSTFGGTCAASFQCAGDAIQCAMAREQHMRNCQAFDTPTPLSQIGEAAATGTDPQDHPKNQVQETAINLASMISSVPMFGGTGMCPQDVPVSVQGRSFSIPFSTMCPYLQLLGAAFLASCYLAAAYIVFGRG